MKSFIYLIFVIGSSSLILGDVPKCEKTQFVCYYGSWATYRQGVAKFTVKDIDPFVCTHVVYTFVGLEETSGNVIYLDSYLDLSDEWHKGALDQLVDLRTKNPDLKLMVAVGGWNEGSEKYSRVCADPVKRKRFINSAVDMVLRHGLNGFDVDWEYPAQRGGAASDRECFSTLLKEFREEADRRGRSDLLLSVAVSANAVSIPLSYNCGAVSKYVDFINVMTYDLHGSWEAKANHHTALEAHSCENPVESYLNLKSAIQSWIDNGADPCKINLGLASYGRSYELTAPTASCDVCAPSSGPYKAGEEVGESGFLAYREICRKIKEQNWRVCYSDQQKSPFVSQDKLWVGYDDPESITVKVNWAKEKGLGGVMIWSVETDDHVGVCGLGKFPLCNAIKSAWFSDRPVSTSRPETTTTVKTTQGPTTAAPTTAAPTTSGPVMTQPPDLTDTTPNFDSTTTANLNKCEAGASFYRDEQDCSVFYSCDTGFKAHRFQCPAGTYFDLTLIACNHKELVKDC